MPKLRSCLPANTATQETGSEGWSCSCSLRCTCRIRVGLIYVRFVTYPSVFAPAALPRPYHGGGRGIVAGLWAIGGPGDGCFVGFCFAWRQWLWSLQGVLGEGAGVVHGESRRSSCSVVGGVGGSSMTVSSSPPGS